MVRRIARGYVFLQIGKLIDQRFGEYAIYACFSQGLLFYLEEK